MCGRVRSFMSEELNEQEREGESESESETDSVRVILV